VLPRGIKALCEDQAMRTAILASLPTLDDGGLAVRQVRADPNREIWMPGTSPDSHQRADPSPGGSSHGSPAPSGKEKESEAANSRSSRDRKEDRSRRLRRGDGSFMGELAPKRQRMTESGGQSSSRAPLPLPCRQQPQGRPEEPRRRRRLNLHSSARHRHRHRPNGSSRPHRHHHHSSSSRPRHRHRRRLRRSSPAGRPVFQAGWGMRSST
jgi:hypothetical protein